MQSYYGGINDSSKESGLINIEPKETKHIIKKITQKAQKLISLQGFSLRTTKSLNVKPFRNIIPFNLTSNKLISISTLQLCQELVYLNLSSPELHYQQTHICM